MKKMVSLILVVLALCTLAVPVYAATENTEARVESNAEESVAEQEVTQWYFRTNPTTGKGEMRLWSVTYGYWITDWLPA